MPLPPSQAYRALRSIHPTDYERIIRTYEEKENEIGRLDVVENFELTVLYVDALFETGEYRKHQLIVDYVIQASIRYGIREVPDREGDVFEYQLFRKAASAFRVQEYATAEHVVRELLRMQPSHDLYFRLLRTTLFKKHRSVLQFGRAAFIFCILMTALVVTLNLLIVRNFYATHASLMDYLSIEVFIIGLALLGGSYGYAYYLSDRDSREFQRNVENKRRL